MRSNLEVVGNSFTLVEVIMFNASITFVCLDFSIVSHLFMNNKINNMHKASGDLVTY